MWYSIRIRSKALGLRSRSHVSTSKAQTSDLSTSCELRSAQHPKRFAKLCTGRILWHSPTHAYCGEIDALDRLTIHRRARLPAVGEAAWQPRNARINGLALLLWAVTVRGGHARRYRRRACDAMVVVR